MKEYYNPKDFFTKEDSVGDIRKKLTTMPKKGDPDFKPWHDESIILCGMWWTIHGFALGSGCAENKDGTNADEAEGIYNHLHWGDKT